MRTVSMTKKQIQFKPLGDRVLVRRLEEKETKKGGIILPDTAKKKPEKTEVVAIGSGKKTQEGKLLPIPVKVGDVVLIDKYAGQEVLLNDEEFIVIRSDDIVAIMEE
jgi:chaperonin GroES